MLRIATLTATAALIALPASAESLRISTTGKSAEQLHAEIVRAARTVCRRENRGVTFEDAARAICVREAVKDGVAQARNPQLTRISSPTLAMR